VSGPTGLRRNGASVIFHLPGYRVMAPSTCRWAVAGSRFNLLILLMAARTVMVVSLSHC
jgi:hypothetical protein